jgi:hypothetical protein
MCRSPDRAFRRRDRILPGKLAKGSNRLARAGSEGHKGHGKSTVAR